MLTPEVLSLTDLLRGFRFRHRRRPASIDSIVDRCRATVRCFVACCDWM